MPDEAHVVLAQLLSDHGRELAQDPRRLRAMLADTMPGTADAKRLVAAAEEGIPDQLLAIGSDETGAARLQLIRRLEEQRDMTSAAAAWTVDAWAAALEVPLRQTDPIVTGPIPGPVPGDAGGGSGGMETIPQDRSRDDLPPPPQRPWWIAAVAGAVLLGVAVVALLFILRPPDGGTAGGSITPTPSPSADASTASEPPPSDEPPPSETPDPTPTPTLDPFTDADRELLGWLPADIRDSCEVEDYTDYGRPLSQLSCDVRGLASTVYLMYADAATMRRQYDDIVPVPTNTGRCSTGRIPSETAWEDGDDIVRGRISCFRQGGDLFVVWTTGHARVVAWGSRADGNYQKLFEAWANRAVLLSP